jgi:hypothetical protein
VNIIKADIFEGNVYLLDETGIIWKVVRTSGGIEINTYKIATISYFEIDKLMKSELAKYEGK